MRRTTTKKMRGREQRRHGEDEGREGGELVRGSTEKLEMQYFCTVKNCGLDALDELHAAGPVILAHLGQEYHFGWSGKTISRHYCDG